MLQYLVIVGAGLNFSGTLLYLRDTIHGDTKPNRVSFVLWALSPMIATAAALSDGVRWAVLPVFMSGFGPLVIFVASFFNKRAYWKLGRFDYLCGLFSVLALILWQVTHNPSIAILFAIISDGFATLPTLVKAWSRPDTETAVSYLLALVAALTSFAALRSRAFTEYAFPSYLVIANLLLYLTSRRTIQKNAVR